MEQPWEKTHAVLDSRCTPGGLLDSGGDRASSRLYENDPRRRHIKNAIVEAYLAEQDGIDHGAGARSSPPVFPVPGSPPRSNPAVWQEKGGVSLMRIGSRIT